MNQPIIMQTLLYTSVFWPSHVPLFTAVVKNTILPLPIEQGTKITIYML